MMLSARGRDALLNPHGAATQSLLNQYGDILMEAKKKAFSEENHNGYLDCNTSENKLSYHILEDAIRNASQEVPANAAGYDSMRGILKFRKALAKFFSKFVFKNEVAEVDANHIVVSSGISTLLDTVFFGIADEDDGVLIPSPYHSRFDRNLRIRSSMNIIPVPTDDNNYVVTPEKLSKAAEEAVQDGRCKRIRAVLLTNPNNPVGNVYSRNQIELICEWCMLNNIHLVSDEVYAVSIYNAQASFISAASVAFGDNNGTVRSTTINPDLIHIIWGLSKDFCMSGFRVGVLYSRSESLIKVLGNISMFNGVSNHTQYTLSTVFEDEELISMYIKENVCALQTSYKTLTKGLDSHNIQYVEGEGGLFVWINARPLLLQDVSINDGDVSLDLSMQLFDFLVRKHRVLLSPGHICHASSHGYFRCCFAAISLQAIEELVERLGRVWRTFPKDSRNKI